MLFIQVEQHCVKRCTHHGQDLEAVKCFEHMQSEGLSPNAVIFICTLKDCRSTETMHKGEQIHDRIMSMQLLEGDIVLVPLW